VTGYGTVNSSIVLTQVFVDDGGDDTVDGGEGNDLVYAYYTGRTQGISFDLANKEGNSLVTQGAVRNGAGELVGGTAAGSFTSVERIIFRGGVGDDTVRGGGTLDSLIGNEGNDILDGWYGDDSLQGNAGDDVLIGGEGLDTATFVNNTTGVTVDLRITTAQNTGEGNDTFLGIEYLTGGTGSDTFNGTDDFNLISDSSGGNDSFFGHGGDDMLNITRSAAITTANTLTMDGGAGDDIIQLNSGTVTPSPAANAIGLSAGTGREVTALGAVGTRYLDNVTVNAGDGSDRVVLTAVKTATVNLGAGNDIISLSMLGAAGDSAHTLTLGAGADTIQLAVSTTAANNVAASTIARNNVVTDFQAGNGGDRFELTEFLNRSLVGYTANSNPFTSGHLRLLQSGPDLLLQVDRDGSGSANGFVTIFTLLNGASSAFTAENFDGFTPVVVASGTPGRRHDPGRKRERHAEWRRWERRHQRQRRQ
jgi:Ca2+-binding RTX toxin-like protein